MASIALSSGHGAKISGAVGIINEVQEARKVCDKVGDLLRAAGVSCRVYHENTATSVSQNLANIGNWHNAQTRDRDVSVHFNASKVTSSPVGTECLYLTQQTLAAQVSKAMADAGGFKNRGAKKRTNLYFLNKVAKPAILLEVCFVDSSADVAAYRKNFDNICRAIAESIASVKLPGEPPVVEPPPPGPTEPELTGEHTVDINITVKGKPLVTINEDVIYDGNPANRVDFTMSHTGDVLLTVDGEDFAVTPPPPTVDYPVLREGSRGEAVRILQQGLADTGLGMTVDGIFGPNTRQMVQAFQSTRGLTADGIVGPLTWAALAKEVTLPPFEEAEWQEDIKASVFGGSSDPNNSAYPPFDFITNTELSVALPFKFTGTRPKVLVRNRRNRQEVVCTIRDLGPWLIDDPYWEKGVRPEAETCWKNKMPLSRGPNKGKIPNGAGIDLTVAAAKAIGLSGMGQVDWMFL